MPVVIADPAKPGPGQPTLVTFKVTGLKTGVNYMVQVVDATGRAIIVTDASNKKISPMEVTAGSGQLTLDLTETAIGLTSGGYRVELFSSGNYNQTTLTPNAGATPVGSKDFQLLSKPPTSPAGPAPSLVQLQRTASEPTPDQVLWELIDAWTKARAFQQYKAHIDAVVCRTSSSLGSAFEPGVYKVLVDQTREFLKNPIPIVQVGALDAYTGPGGIIPYLAEVAARYPDAAGKDPCSDVVAAALQDPFPVELIWSYWHEEGAVVQSLNHILARFQNRRPGRRIDPLARFDLNPLRPLRHILWSWAEDEYARLTVRRRAAEYEYEYGLALVGTAIPGSGLWAERRTKFLAAFHTLLHVCHRFFLQDDDTTVQSDAFPVLNALKETHLVLSEGAHNQFGDLPTEARVQMLVMQWLLAQPEMRDFLGGRPMVPYAEPWMDRVDTMKSIQGWTDTSVTHFRDLAVYGEQLLLSIRYGNWNSVIDAHSATNWARKWRPQIQQYVHSYRAATGVDLTVRVDASMPAGLLARRVSAQRRRA
jgi:hypothetical protein